MTEVVLPPIKYNVWKHHFNYLQQQIEHWANTKEIENRMYLSNLLKIGGSQMDMYMGGLSPQMVADEILEQIKNLGFDAPESYQIWLKEHQNYQKLHISDGSTWTLLWGDEADRHIHIHPARYAQHTQRIDANTLKTIILISVDVKINQKEIDLKCINQIRSQYLDLSPIKKLTNNQGLSKWLSVFCQHY